MVPVILNHTINLLSNISVKIVNRFLQFLQLSFSCSARSIISSSTPSSISQTINSAISTINYYLFIFISTNTYCNFIISAINSYLTSNIVAAFSSCDNIASSSINTNICTIAISGSNSTISTVNTNFLAIINTNYNSTIRTLDCYLSNNLLIISIFGSQSYVILQIHIIISTTKIISCRSDFKISIFWCRNSGFLTSLTSYIINLFSQFN